MILSGLPGVPYKGPSRLIPGPGVGASFKVQGQAFTLKAHAQALKRPALIHDVFHLFHLWLKLDPRVRHQQVEH